MKIYKKFMLLTAGIAMATSTITIAAMHGVSDLVEQHRDLAIAETLQSVDNDTASGSSASRSTKQNVSSTTRNTDFTNAAEKAINSVVSIKSYVNRKSSANSSYQSYFDNFFNDPFFEYFFGSPNSNNQKKKKTTPKESEEKEDDMVQAGLGSGVIISTDGYIVTNNHVIDGADKLEITLNDNSTYEATVIGSDKGTDLALIKIDATGLDAIKMGDSDNLKVGEWVLAVGNPFGFTSTVTTGIVSAKARNISSSTQSRGSMGIESYIQTDAAVNPGNSGGALVNLDGELVGINAAIYSQTGNYAGYSFAIPTSLVTKAVADIKEFGSVQRPYLGVKYADLTPKIKKEKGITKVNDGLYVASVVPDKAADKAGIKEGDVIIAINNEPTRNSGQLFDQLNRYRPGDKVTLTFIRDNKEMTAEVQLYNDEGTTKAKPKKSVNASVLGCTFEPASDETLEKLGLSSGVEVTSVSDGKFKDAGIKKGFIISDINNTYVKNKEDIERLYKSIVSQDDYDHVMFISGYENGKKKYYAVDLAD